MKDSKFVLGNVDWDFTIRWLGGSDICFKVAGVVSHIANSFSLPVISLGFFTLGNWLSREILTEYKLKNSLRNQFIKK